MKKEKLISTTDLEIISKILFPNSELIIVFDPLKKINISKGKNRIHFSQELKLNSFILKNEDSFSLINFSTQSLSNFQNQKYIEGIIDFSKNTNKTFTKFFHINNPDGTIRWVFPKSNDSACFLNLYNGSGWKAILFGLAAKSLNKINFLQPIINGQFSVYIKNKEQFKSSFNGIPFEDFAIFTGTVGENRKAIVALSKNRRCTHFIKIPLTKSSLKLVENEFQKLYQLGKSSFTSTLIPKANYFERGVSVTNVLPHQKNNNQDWSSLHWKSLLELYKNSNHQKVLYETSFWKTIENGIQFLNHPFFIKNNLDPSKIKKLNDSLLKLYHDIDSSKMISVGIGHGDFTPWNMYVGKDKLHIYDWEMSQFDIPLLVDVFHYFFQKGILIDRKNFNLIKNDLFDNLKDENAKRIVELFKLDIQENFKLYFLFIICYYLPKYIVQPKLHEQVHWLINTWLEALENIKRHTEIKSHLLTN